MGLIVKTLTALAAAQSPMAGLRMSSSGPISQVMRYDRARSAGRSLRLAGPGPRGGASVVLSAGLVAHLGGGRA